MTSSRYAQDTSGSDGSIAFLPAPKQPATNFPVGPMTLKSNGNAGYPQVTDAASTRLTVSALHALGAAFPAQTYIHPYMIGDEEPTDGGQYHWYCCQCGEGPLNLSVHVECISCNDHPRCSECTVYPTK